jgi:hypothetical protein
MATGTADDGTIIGITTTGITTTTITGITTTGIATTTITGITTTGITGISFMLRSEVRGRPETRPASRRPHVNVRILA